MKMKEDTFIKLFVHKMNPVKAFVLGQLKLEGSRDELTKFAETVLPKMRPIDEPTLILLI